MPSILIIDQKLIPEYESELSEKYELTHCNYSDAAELMMANVYDIIIYNSAQNFSAIELAMANFNSLLKKCVFIFINYQHPKNQINVRSYFMKDFSTQKFFEKENLLLAMKTL